MEYSALSCSSNGVHWQAANITKIHQLAQGTATTPGTNTMFFIPVTALPTRHKATTYLCIVCAHHPEKSVPHWVHWTVGGDRAQYDGNVSTKMANLTTAKLLFNSVVSMPKAKCMMGDLKDFYLGTPMDPKDYAYMCIPVHMLPNNIIQHYNLALLIHNGHVYVEIQHGMYSLPQAGLLTNLQLQCFLAPHSYAPCPTTPGLW